MRKTLKIGVVLFCVVLILACLFAYGVNASENEDVDSETVTLGLDDGKFFDFYYQTQENDEDSTKTDHRIICIVDLDWLYEASMAEEKIEFSNEDGSIRKTFSMESKVVYRNITANVDGKTITYLAEKGLALFGWIFSGVPVEVSPKSATIKNGSEGLDYTYDEVTDSYIVSGIGTCKDSDVVIPNTYEGKRVTSIGDGAFWNCRSLTSITIPDSVTNIFDEVFYGCENLSSITITGGSTSENILLGQTPLTLSNAATVKLVGSGEHTYTIKGKTVADLSTATTTAVGATFTVMDEYIEIKATQDSAWYSSHVDISVSGLTVGESYILAINGLGVTKIDGVFSNNGHYIIKSSTGETLATALDSADGTTVNIPFSATTTDIVIIWYPASNYWWNTEGHRTARIIDMYINKATDGTERTDVINESGTFTDSFVLGKLSKGITITSAPSCEVYNAISTGGDTGSASLPLAGKTVVCFGDSLFGMYTGDTSAPAYVAKRTGATVYNVGFGGCRMSVHPYTGYNEFCMYALAKAIADGDWSAQDAAASKGSANFPDQLSILKEIDFDKVDAIVIHYGTNDFTGSVAIGKDSPATDTSTLCGALRYSIETLLTAYPKLRIFVSVPAFRYWTADDGTITDSDSYTNGNGKTLVDYVTAIAEVAKAYNLPVIDSYYGLGINKVNAATFLADGVHHNVEGRKRFGNYIGSRMIAEF